MQQMMYKGYCITNNGKYYSIKGFVNTFYSLDAAKLHVDSISQPIIAG